MDDVHSALRIPPFQLVSFKGLQDLKVCENKEIFLAAASPQWSLLQHAEPWWLGPSRLGSTEIK